MINKNKIIKYIYITLCILIMLPSTIFVYNVSQTKVLSIFIILLFLVIALIKYKIFLKKPDVFVVFTLIFAFINILSLFIKIVTEDSIVFNEVFDSFRYIIFSMLYLIILYINKNKNIRKLLITVLCICFFVSALIGISQYFDFLNLNELYIPKIAPTQYASLMPGYPNKRIIGLNTNPTIFGFNMIVAILLNYVYWKYVNKNKFKVLFLITIVEIVALFMTNSRTAQIALIIMLCTMYFIYTYKNYGKKYAFKHMVFAFLMLILIILFLFPENLTWRLLQVFDLKNVTSWTARIVKWEAYFDIIKENIFIGVGPIKNLGIGYIDSEWIQIVLQTGVLGLISYFFMILSPLYIFRKELDKLYIYIGLLVSLVLYNLASTTILNYEIAFKYFIFIAILNGIKMNKEQDYLICYDGDGIPIDKSKCNKRVLVIATYFPPMGGVGVFRVSKFVKYLDRHGIEPIVITINKENYSNCDYELLKNIPNNVRIYRINIKKKGKDISFTFYKKLKKQIYKILKNESPDHVFITGGPFYILPIGRFVYNHFKIPYTIDLRDPWTLQKRICFSFSLRSLKINTLYLLENVMEKYSLSKAKNVITVNDTMSEQYGNKYPPLREKIHTITNGVDISDFNNIMAKEGFKKNTIIYTGKFNVSAGFRDPSCIFASMKKLKLQGYDYNFIHVGIKDEKVIELAKEFDIIDNCSFVGVKSYNETISYCKSSDVLLVIGGTEKSEQTGKIFDYMGCKKRVLALCRQDGEIAKVCNDIEEFYTCEANNIEKICLILKHMYENELDFRNYQINIKYTREYITEELSRFL